MHLAVRPEHGELAHGDAGQLLHHPAGIVAQSMFYCRLPFRPRELVAEHNAFAAEGTIRLEHERLMLAPHVFQQAVGSAIRQQCLPVGKDARPQDMPAEHLAVVGVVVALGETRIGQHFPAALLVKFRRDRRDDAVLLEQGAHGFDVHALLLELKQIQHRIVTIGEIDDLAFVVDFRAGQTQL